MRTWFLNLTLALGLAMGLLAGAVPTQAEVPAPEPPPDPPAISCTCYKYKSLYKRVVYGCEKKPAFVNPLFKRNDSQKGKSTTRKIQMRTSRFVEPHPCNIQEPPEEEPIRRAQIAPPLPISTPCHFLFCYSLFQTLHSSVINPHIKNYGLIFGLKNAIL